MSASAVHKILCVTCNKSTGILTCHGCQRVFCGKHVIEHRQELAAQLDSIAQDYDIFKHDVSELALDDSSIEKINQWEEEYVKKIRLAAETSRKNLQNSFDQSKQQLINACHDIAVGICTSRTADDYAENELARWKEQLEQLKSESSIQCSINITENQKSIVHSLTHPKKKSDKEQTVNNEQSSSSNSPNQDKFLDVLGAVKLEDKGHLAKQMLTGRKHSYIQGQSLYSTGRHVVRIKIEKYKQPYHIFFGCKSSETVLKGEMEKSVDVVGWFGFNQVYEHGQCSSNCKKHKYKSNLIQQGDVIHVIFDCNERTMCLFNSRLNITNKLKVNVNNTPYPWRLLIILSHKDDCVRMLRV
ncbi:unnamed protein product [Adineta ricciae]|uniref:B box-type domain-containing protein n=1 Tax=Adineta ricciae TaxID=249248 RepID=A0A813QBE3_ADIRI|nr:unnamed protein product [Adineta ricciae]CAF1071899.1 unnamed protein product [Adineta ricciae]